MFSTPYEVGEFWIEKAMPDLGASINVMPLSIFDEKKMGPLREIGVSFNSQTTPTSIQRAL